MSDNSPESAYEAWNRHVFDCVTCKRAYIHSDPPEMFCGTGQSLYIKWQESVKAERTAPAE